MIKEKNNRCSYPGCKYKAIFKDACYQHIPKDEKEPEQEYIIDHSTDE